MANETFIPPLHDMLECRSIEELQRRFPKLNHVTCQTIMKLAFDLIDEWKREVVNETLTMFEALKYTKLSNREQLELWHQKKGL